MTASETTDDDASRDVARCAEALIVAFGSHDVAHYFAHFSEDATFIFYSTDRVLRSRDEYEHLWRKWEREDGFRVNSCESKTGVVRMLGTEAAVFTHDVTTVVSNKTENETLQERETIVFARRDNQWIAVHEHLST